MLSYSEWSRWIVTCNFAEFDIYDMENPKGEPSRILLKDLEREYYRLQFLVEQQGVHLQREMEVSMKAGEIVGKLYDAFVSQYDADDPESLRYLNILCVRLVFCLYAEDAGRSTSTGAKSRPPSSARNGRMWATSTMWGHGTSVPLII